MQLWGTRVCSGMGLAKVLIVEPPLEVNLEERETLPAGERREKLAWHLERLEEEMTALSGQLLEKGGHDESEMLMMHLAMLQDDDFRESICSFIEKGYSLAASVMRGAKEMGQSLIDSGDAYMAERAGDAEDIAVRLICHIKGTAFPSLARLNESVIIAADDIGASLLMGADYEQIRGIVLSRGSKTAHISILAASLEIPMLINCGDLSALYDQAREDPDAYVFLNAMDAYLSFRMSDREKEDAAKAKTAYEAERAVLEQYKTVEAKTLDGRRIYINGNIVETQAIANILKYGGDGVGLFRTEFMFMNRKTLPSEDEQYAVYYVAAKKLNGKSLVIRTMDIGADKPVEALQLDPEENPFLGYRAIRVCLGNQELFRTQLRAILRASVFGNIRILVPMISSIHELDQTLEALEQVKADLDRGGIGYDKKIPLGIMIEIPSTAILADDFIKKADFFSIGSNDLTQYTLAVDRMNEKVQYLYNSLDPAVLHLIGNAIDAAARAGKYCGLCGEMAADAGSLPVLVGMGLVNISVNPASILPLKRLIEGLNYEELRAKYAVCGAAAK
jgi:phosphotransferase system enzyme I (PtsI)